MFLNFPNYFVGQVNVWFGTCCYTPSVAKLYQKLSAIVVFGIAFGLLEAIIVIYIQQLLGSNVKSLSPGNFQVLLNLGAIAFILPNVPILKDNQLSLIEMIREFSTIIILLMVAFLAGESIKQKIGAFLLSFAIWDIFYYVFLRVFTGWPTSFLSLDIFFLIPVPWIGPVITPIVISILLIIIGIKLLTTSNSERQSYLSTKVVDDKDDHN